MTATNSHIQALKYKHSKLEEAIKIANDNFQEEIFIKRLKKKKLLLKEKIVQLENSVAENSSELV